MISIQKTLLGRKIFDRRIYWFVLAFVFLFGFDAVAIYFSLYFHHEWVDLPVHVLGGFQVGLLLYYVVFVNEETKEFIRRLVNPSLCFVTIGMVIMVACSWEIFEFIIGRTYISNKFYLDTALDIAMTTLGSVGAYLTIRSGLFRK